MRRQVHPHVGSSVLTPKLSSTLRGVSSSILNHFCGQLLDRAVRDRRLDGIVELPFSSASSLRRPTATPRPRTPPDTPAPAIIMSLNSGLLERRLQGRMRREDGVDAACREIEVVLLGGLVLADRRPCP